MKSRDAMVSAADAIAAERDQEIDAARRAWASGAHYALLWALELDSRASSPPAHALLSNRRAAGDGK